MGWDIKLKNKSKKIILIILIIIGVLALGFGIYYFVDFVLNGSFVNWFEGNYMLTEYKYLPEIREEAFVHSVIWSKLKPALLNVFIINILIMSIIVIIVSLITGKKREKKIITDVSKKLHKYMNEEIDVNEVFGAEQSEISAQITEIKSKLLQNEQKLKEETNRKNDLIAYLAHDLKTPLTSMTGYLSILDEIDDMPKKQQKKYIGIALDKSYRLEELINELFDIVRFNTEHIILEKEELNINLMLEQIIDDFYPVLEEESKSIKLNTDENVNVMADPDKLSRVFNNLIKNAISYSKEKSDITINVNKNNDNVLIEVINKGKQISEENINKIFEKFFRVDSSRGTKTGGCGLGLAIAKEIVELHNGKITAESNKVETKFQVILPYN